MKYYWAIKKEQSINEQHNMQEPWKYHTSMYDSIYMKYPSRQICKGKDQIGVEG